MVFGYLKELTKSLYQYYTKVFQVTFNENLQQTPEKVFSTKNERYNPIQECLVQTLVSYYSEIL